MSFCTARQLGIVMTEGRMRRIRRERSRSTDQLSNASSGYETGVSALRGGTAGGGPNTLAALLESVLSALDEPKGGCGF